MGRMLRAGFDQLRTVDNSPPSDQAFLPVGGIEVVDRNRTAFAWRMYETVVAYINADVRHEDTTGPEEYQVARLQAAEIHRCAQPVLLVTIARYMQAQLCIAVLHQSAAIETRLRLRASEYVGSAALVHGNAHQLPAQFGIIIDDTSTGAALQQAVTGYSQDHREAAVSESCGYKCILVSKGRGYCGVYSRKKEVLMSLVTSESL